MTEQTLPEFQADPLEDVLRAELMQGDGVLLAARPILRQLLANDDRALFSDEVIARVRAMILHIARAVLHDLADAAGEVDQAGFVAMAEGDFCGELLRDDRFLGQAHVAVVEAQLADRLHARSGIDPVLSPLLQELVASPDPDLAQLAMHVLSAQARFMQQQRRMEWPLAELPGDLFHTVMQVLQVQTCATEEARAACHARLRERFDESQRRVSQLARLIMGMERKAPRALALDHAGLAMFATALGMASEQNRDLALMSLCDNQFARLALSLRAAGLSQEEVEKQFLFLHPDIELPPNFEILRSDRASALLAASDVDGNA